MRKVLVQSVGKSFGQSGIFTSFSFAGPIYAITGHQAWIKARIQIKNPILEKTRSQIILSIHRQLRDKGDRY